MTLEDDARAELAALAAAHRLRTPRTVDGRQGPTVVLDGRAVLNLASNDYLSLAGDRRITTAAMAALDSAGAGAGASRLVVGNHRQHVELERVVAEWMRCGGVRLFNSGYAANTGVLSTLAGAGDAVISDALNHASLIDGCRLSRAEIAVFPHRDVAGVERLLRAHVGARRRFVVTESLFSMDGDVADLEALAELCRRHDASLIVDEAHAVGTWGPEGRGIAASVGVVPDVVIGAFGKAAGTFGAFAASSAPVADLLWNRARSLVFSTGLPPMIAAATIAAIEVIRGGDGDDRRVLLAARAAELRARIPCAGGAAGSAIAPLVIGDDRRVMAISGQLLEAGIFVQGIRPPTVPEGTARLRVSLSAGLTAQQLDSACIAIDDAVRRST